MTKKMISWILAAACCGAVAFAEEDIVEENEPSEPVKYHYEGACLPVKPGSDALVLSNLTIAVLNDCTFKATMCGAWVNEGKPRVVRGYNKDYREGECLSIQFQCSDYSIADKKGYVKCVRVVFTDSPEGVKAVCDYSGYVTLGYQGNAVGFKFNGAANWKAVDSPDGKGYGIQSFTAFPIKALEYTTSTPEGYLDDLDAALEKARKENKRVLMVFSASDLSVSCRHFTTNVLENADFKEEISKSYVPVFIDRPEESRLLTDKALVENPKIREKYRAWGYPSIIVVDADGKVAARPYVHSGMEWEDVILALAGKPLPETELDEMPVRTERQVAAIFKALVAAQIVAASPGEIAASAFGASGSRGRRGGAGERRRDYGIHYPAAKDARVETEYYKDVAMPFYEKIFVAPFEADASAGGKHHDEILAMRRKFAWYIAMDRDVLFTGEELLRADKLWNNENVRDIVVGLLYLTSLRTWERSVNKNWARTMSECRKLAVGDPMMEMLVEFHNACNGGSGAKRWQKFEDAFTNALPAFAEADDRLLIRYAKYGGELSRETIAKLPSERMKAVALSEKLMQEAFAARGGGWASQVTPEGGDMYREKLKEGVKVLKDALEKHPGDAFLLSRLAYYSGCTPLAGVETVPTIMEACRSSLDFARENRKQMLHFLTTRWGGSTGLLREFAIRAADDVRVDSMFAYDMAAQAVSTIMRWEIEDVCPAAFYHGCYSPELADALFKMFDAYIAGERGPYMPDADFFRISAMKVAIATRDFERAFAYAKQIKRRPKLYWDYDWPSPAFDTYIMEFSVRAFMDGRHMDRFVEAMKKADSGSLADRRAALETYKEILAKHDADGDEKCFVSLELYRQRTFLDLAEKGEADLTPTFEFGEADNIWAKPKDKGNGWIQWHSNRRDLKLMSRVQFPYAGAVYSGEVKLAGEGAKFEFSPCRACTSADSLSSMPFLSMVREGDKVKVRFYTCAVLPPRSGRTRRLTWDDHIAAEKIIDTIGFHTWEMDLGDAKRDFVVRIDGEELCRFPAKRIYAATKEWGSFILEGDFSYPVWTIEEDAYFRNPRIRIH